MLALIVRLRTVKVLLSAYFAWFTVPLVLASITRPLAFWDHLTVANVFHYGRPTTWANLIPNYLHHLWTGLFMIRPTMGLLIDLETLAWGGEFWIYYLLKWAAKGLTLFLAATALRQLDCGWAARIAVIFLLAFHHSSFTLMLHAPDGWVALGMFAQLVLLIPVKGDLRELNGARLAAFHLLAWFTLGLKEVAYVFEGALLLFLLARFPKNWRRLLPLACILIFWTYRLASASSRASGFVFSEWFHRFAGHVTLLIPGSTLQILHLLFALAGIATLRLIWRERSTFRGQLLLFCGVTAMAMLAFTTIPPIGALRYVLPSFYLLGICFGAALQSLGPMRRWAAGLIVAAYPLITAGVNYQQELAYQHELFAENVMLKLVELDANQGKEIVLTGAAGDLEGEPGHSIRSYLKDVGPRWYGEWHSWEVRNAKQSGWPHQPAVLVSALDPSEIFDPSKGFGLDCHRVGRIRGVIPGDFGTLSRLTAFYLAFDKAVGRRGAYVYDTGAPEVLPGPIPRFYLYTLDASGKRHGRPPVELIPTSRLPGAF